MIKTHSKFYFDISVTNNNRYIDLDEGSEEITATLELGEYTLTQFVTEIERAIEEVADDNYTVSVARATRIITITNADTNNFDLLFATGTNAGSSAASLMGFGASDLTGTDTYTGSTGVGSSYSTQFFLQNYVTADDWKQKTDAAVNKSASGRVEVVSFGTESFYEWSFRFITDVAQGSNSVIRNRTTGVSDLRAFMDFLITKAAFEFIPDENNVSTFVSLILESTPESQTGTGYKLKELFGQNLVDYYETGTLKFRVV
jgi:hypothetical protein